MRWGAGRRDGAQQNINSPKDVRISILIFFSARRNPSVLKCSSSASPNVHKYITSTSRRADITEIFWAEVEARTVPFLRGFAAAPQLGRGGDARGSEEPAMSLPRCSNQTQAPKAAEDMGGRKLLEKKICISTIKRKLLEKKICISTIKKSQRAAY